MNEKPPLSELAHYGVKGMKWGQRATAAQIKTARKNLKGESAAYRKDYKRYDKLSANSPKKAALEKKLRERHQDYLKNPDRVIAARMTNGEKFGALLFGAETGPGFGVAVGTIATTAAVSKTIAYKQAKGSYNKARDKPVAKSIGAQTARTLAVNGALIAPGILSYAGKQASARIIMKAGANRNAARAAPEAAKAIGAVASKLKYAKAARGAFKITTMK